MRDISQSAPVKQTCQQSSFARLHLRHGDVSTTEHASHFSLRLHFPKMEFFSVCVWGILAESLPVSMIPGAGVLGWVIVVWRGVSKCLSRSDSAHILKFLWRNCRQKKFWFMSAIDPFQEPERTRCRTKQVAASIPFKNQKEPDAGQSKSRLHWFSLYLHKQG